MTFDTPILFLIFNRPDTTAQVFERISALRPKYLYIAADGPRKNKKTDVENCRQTRNIVQNIDWHCEVKILFQEKNLGCGKAPATAITWFFDHVEEGIILEDDCLPDPSFFTFCQTLLGYYRTDARVALLSGNAHYPGSLPPESYYFLKYPATWGWATWRRTWQQYDYELNNLPTNSILFSEFWNVTFDKIYHKKMTTCWDYQLYYLMQQQQSLCLIPSVNLVKNIGFGEYATHTSVAPDWYAAVPLAHIGTLRHPLPSEIKSFEPAELWAEQHIFQLEPPLTFYFRLRRKITYLTNKFFHL